MVAIGGTTLLRAIQLIDLFVRPVYFYFLRVYVVHQWKLFYLIVGCSFVILGV